MTPVHLYREASKHQRDGDIDKARLLYKQLISEFPHTEQAGYAEIELGNTEVTPTKITPKTASPFSGNQYLTLLVNSLLPDSVKSDAVDDIVNSILEGAIAGLVIGIAIALGTIPGMSEGWEGISKVLGIFGFFVTYYFLSRNRARNLASFFIGCFGVLVPLLLLAWGLFGAR